MEIFVQVRDESRGVFFSHTTRYFSSLFKDTLKSATINRFEILCHLIRFEKSNSPFLYFTLHNEFLRLEHPNLLKTNILCPRHTPASTKQSLRLSPATARQTILQSHRDLPKERTSACTLRQLNSRRGPTKSILIKTLRPLPRPPPTPFSLHFSARIVKKERAPASHSSRGRCRFSLSICLAAHL